MPLWDTHAHLDHCEEVASVLERARQADVVGVIAVSVDLASAQKTRDLAKREGAPRIFPALGMHPGHLHEEDMEELESFLRAYHQEIVAVGEIGLDFWYKDVRKDKQRKDQQRRIFRRCLEWARDLDLPVIVHSRGTWRECFETVRDVGVKAAVFHWYSGPVDVCEDIMAAGYMISATPNCAYSPPARTALEAADANQILVETDTPVFYRGPNGEGFSAEPKDVWRSLEALAALKGMDKESLGARVNANACRLFDLSGPIEGEE